MKIAILGGGNCYALNLANVAKKNKFDVFGIGRNPPKVPGLWQVFKEYRYYEAHLVFHFQAALAILDTERPDYIVNFAAQGEGQGSFDQPDLFYETNTVALVRLAEELKKRRYLKRFIQVGTSELYGSVAAPSKETDPIQPTSPYAVSKAAFDLHLDILRRFGFPCSVIRPSNAYTPGQQLHRVIPRCMLAALSGTRFPLAGGGQAFKTYTHASDLSRAILILLTSEPGIYNCAVDEPISIRRLVELCVAACGKNFDDVVDLAPERLGQDGKYHLDSSKLKALGWEPSIDLEEGLYGMVDWIRSNPELLSMPTDWMVRP